MTPAPTNYPEAGEHVVFQPEFVEFGGEERVILSLCRELHLQGKPHAVLCYKDHIDLAKYAEWPLKIYQLLPGTNPVARVLSLRRCLRRIHVQGGPVPVLFNIQSAYHAGLAADAPYHLRVPDTYSLLRFVPEGAKTAQPTPLELLKSDFARLLQQAATRRGIQKAKLFVTNTRALREEMEALYGRGAEVIYLGGFGAPSTSSPERSANTIELLTVSRLQSSKRIHWILQSLAHIVKDAKKAIPWHLHIVGNGPDGEALKLQAQQLGLADRVQFHGFVSDSDLKALYSKSHVFLMPGKQGYGLPAIEALYQKMGLVLSDESGVVEILGNTNWVAVAHGGQTGFQAALADMMMRVAKPDFVTQPLPELPLEKTWAEKVIQYFKWQ